MNNKLISYEDAVKKLRLMEVQQTFNKTLKHHSTFKQDLEKTSKLQQIIHLQTKEINILLSIIHAHKQARKYYGKLRKLEEKVEKVLLANKR